MSACGISPVIPGVLGGSFVNVAAFGFFCVGTKSGICLQCCRNILGDDAVNLEIDSGAFSATNLRKEPII